MNGGNLILQSPYSADGIARHSENMNSTQSHERSRHENLPERPCPYGGAEKATIYSTPRYRNSDSAFELMDAAFTTANFGARNMVPKKVR
jgi:hypothetical protein